MHKTALFIKKIYQKLPVISYDVLSIPLAWYLAYWFRYNMNPFPWGLLSRDSILSLIVLMFLQTACYYYFKVYRGLWGYTSINDALRIVKAVSAAVVLTIPVLYLTKSLACIPRSVLPLYGMIMIILLCGARLLMRAWRDKSRVEKVASSVKRVLIVGAGQAASGLLRDLKRTQSYFPVGLVDDNASKCGQEIQGVKVLGAIRDLPKITKACQVDLIFIAIPSAGSSLMRRIVARCTASEVPFRTLPGLSDLASGFVQVNALRDVNIEDLLGRDQVHLEWEKIAGCIRGRHVVITGAGGSIGSELCRQIMALGPLKLMLIDNSEYNLYLIEHELREKYPFALIEAVLISVTDDIAIDYHFLKFVPHIILHAAAFKHVPMLETQIRTAVQNNIIGTRIVAEAGVVAGAEKFILISTDKAVNPSNVMGTTKRVAEIYCQNLNERVSTQFITVRFGNVLGSAGSVVPLFQKQLQAGGPLTVTHPDVQRYFMTIPEASQLILQAMANGTGGEIFVLDMGKPIKIDYLASQMISLAGKTPGKDIEIRYTGLRPGEKLYEELFHESEQLTGTAHEKLFKASFRKFDWNELIETMSLLNRACDSHNNDELHILIKSLVPEFNPHPDIVY